MKKRGKKTPRTGYSGGEDWEGGGQQYKRIHRITQLAVRTD
jgi:hypothetical protein